jgi:hypothetical protein
MIGPKALLMLLPMILIQIGTMLKGKDANNTGSDDAAGNICIAAAPAVEAFATSNEKALRKSLIAVRDTIDGYLGS